MTANPLVERAKERGTNPTQECIACGQPPAVRWVPGRDMYSFCERHKNWERSAQIHCGACGYDVGLVCSEGVAS